jgi:quercetin dioxygenase-like cupin family protein
MKKNKTINDFVEITNLDSKKDRKALESGGRGYLIQDIDDVSVALHTNTDARFIAMLVFHPEKQRGNHYHINKTEYILILKGKLKAKFELYDNPNEATETELEAGQLIKILPGCIHTFTAIKDKVIALEFSPQLYAESDVLER